jgi:hypothetical protein
LWAESVKLYREGHRWWPQGEAEHELCAGEQHDRQVYDDWTVRVLKYLDDKDVVSTRDILEHLGLETSHITDRETKRTAKILRQHGWVSERRRIADIEGTSGMNPVRRVFVRGTKACSRDALKGPEERKREAAKAAKRREPRDKDDLIAINPRSHSPQPELARPHGSLDCQENIDSTLRLAHPMGLDCFENEQPDEKPRTDVSYAALLD